VRDNPVVMAPWLSIITVVKDAPDDFAETLASLAAMDWHAVEFVVVDGSADRAVIPEQLQGVPAVYAWVEPAGVYEAMNHALGLARGEFVYYLNAGDRLMSVDALEEIRVAVQAQAATWLYAEVEMLDDRGVPVRTPAWDFDIEQRRCFSRGHFPCHQGMFVRRRTLLDLGGFDTSYRIAADYAVFLQLTLRSRPLHVPEVIAAFQPGGLSWVHWKQASAEFHRARREILRPRGTRAAREQWETWRLRAATSAYRQLWAPGRPAHRFVRRLRDGGPRPASSVR